MVSLRSPEIPEEAEQPSAIHKENMKQTSLWSVKVKQAGLSIVGYFMATNFAYQRNN
jgi:hypothetical protein